MELLIDKKYLIRLERYTKFGYGGDYDPFAVRYVFRLPEWANVPEGYTVQIEAKEVDWEHDENGRLFNNAKPLFTKELENNITYRLDRDNNQIYEAVMTENREKGKRYRRFKYTAEELYALYQNIDLSDAKLVVAQIDIYYDGIEGNRQKILQGNRIEKTVYVIGKEKGSWFYSPELDTKRRIGSHGVTILGNIKADDQATVLALIQKYGYNIKLLEKEYLNIFLAQNRVEKILQSMKFYPEHDDAPKDKEINSAVAAIQTVAEDAKEIISQRLSEEENEKAQMKTDFIKSLSKYFVEVS